MSESKNDELNEGLSVMHHVDARRLFCPMPVIKLQNTIENLPVGDRIELVATDPGTLHDVPAWCRIHGHKVIGSEESFDPREVRITVEICD